MRCKMKHTDEVQAILTVIFAINKTSEHEDKDITLVLDYAFRRLFGANLICFFFPASARQRSK